MNLVKYQEKLKKNQGQTLYHLLDIKEQDNLNSIAIDFLFTFQELKKACECVIDIRKW